MSLSIGEWRDILLIIQTILTAMLGVVVLYLRAAFVTRTKYDLDHAPVLTQLGALAQRVALIENEVEHLPRANSIAALDRHVAELSGTLKAVDTQMRAQSTTIARIEDYLLSARRGT